MSIRTRLKLFLFFLFFIAIINSLATFKLNVYDEEKLLWINHTHEVIIETEIFLGALKDAETGQRGFLLTKDINYLQPYNHALHEIQKSFINLKKLTSDKLLQQKRLADAHTFITLKLSELDQTITHVKNNHHDKAMAIVLENKGKKYMDKIREIFAEFIKTENSLLKQRKEMLEVSRDFLSTLVVFEMLFIALLALFTLIFLNKNLFTPLKLLLRHTEKMKNEEAISLEGTQLPNEMGLLLKSFYDMYENVTIRSTQLKKYRDDLEILVQKEIKKNQKQEQKLIQQSRLAQMGELISMIAHQWRQPLAAISSVSAKIQAKVLFGKLDLQTEQAQKEFTDFFVKELQNIDSYVGDLSTIINDFRDFYKPNKKKVFTKLDKIVSKSLQIIKASLQDDKITIVEQYECNQELSLHDSELLQVILNILKNSQDNFRERQIKKPSIKIYVEDTSIQVCDNGGGIAKDILPTIFDPYFSTKDEKNGTGLGLYMSKIIVEDHHKGTLTAHNHDDGVCFTLSLNPPINTLKK